MARSSRPRERKGGNNNQKTQHTGNGNQDKKGYWKKRGKTPLTKARRPRGKMVTQATNPDDSQ
jgi:hypothetical protein